MALESFKRINDIDLNPNRDLIEIYNQKTGMTGVINPSQIAFSSPSSGVAGAIQFSNGSAFASDAANLFWDDTNKRLGVGTNAPIGVVSINPSTNFTTTSANQIRIGEPTNNVGYYFNLGYFISGSTYKSVIQSFQGTGGDLLLNPNGGNVGIGLASPTARTHIQGSGSTSATTSLLVQNSAGTQLFKVADDGRADFGGTLFGVNGVFSANLNFQSILYGTNFWSQDDGGTTIGAQAAPVASAILDIRSTTRGFLPPRMTTTQKNAIASPATGLVLYDSTTNKLCCYNGSTWNDLF
jgi:hypothetical protein